MSGYTSLLGSRKRKAEPESDNPRPPPSDNWLLAGYMAHEFRTGGTLLGRQPDSTRPAAGPVQNEPGCSKPVDGAYVDVASLLMTDGAHIPGIVNPTQLGKWLQM